MQINNNRQANFYPLVPAESRNSSRLPVTFDSAVETSLTLVDKEQADTSNIVTPVVSAQDNQQAQFVRYFISAESESSQSEQKSTVLPKTVQQYLYIENLDNTKPSGGQIVDEMV